MRSENPNVSPEAMKTYLVEDRVFTEEQADAAIES